MDSETSGSGTPRVGERMPVRGRHTPHCTSTSTSASGWWLCDRPEGHRGAHASVSLSGMVLAVWEVGDFDAL